VADEYGEIMRALGALSDAGTWAEARSIITKNPILLKIDPFSFFRMLIMMAGAVNDDAALASFRQVSTLLKRCQAVGVDAAFLEVAHKEAKQQANMQGLIDVLGQQKSIVLPDFDE
jgi:hypothetical protein